MQTALKILKMVSVCVNQNTSKRIRHHLLNQFVRNAIILVNSAMDLFKITV